MLIACLATSLVLLLPSAIHTQITSILDIIGSSTLSTSSFGRIQHPTSIPRERIARVGTDGWLTYANRPANMAADMCVAVTKYSHATGVKSDNTIPWTHIVTSNVFLVLKGGNTHIRNGQLLLQVVQGNSALVSVN